MGPPARIALSRVRRKPPGRATAHQVAVAVRAVDAAHRRPHLAVVHARRGARRVGGQLAAVRVVPLVGQAGRGVRGAAQRVVLHRPLPRRHPLDLLPDPDHGVDEPVDLGEVLALGRLDHQGARHRERHRRGVQAVVGQPLRDVVDGHAGRLRDPPQVEDALVGHAARRPGVEHRVVLRQPGGDVVGRGDRGQRGPAQPVAAPSAAGRPTGSAARPGCRTGPPTPGRPSPRPGRNGARCSATATGPTPGPAAAVRDAERLVQVEVAHVAAERARPGHADQRVEVGAVDVDLAARRVHRVADRRARPPRTRRAWTGR